MDERIQSQIARDGSRIYIHEIGDKKTALNSVYSPQKEINRFIKEIENIEKKLIVIIGVGNGVIIEELVQSNTFQNNVHFLIIEPFSDIRQSKHLSKIFSENPNKLSFYYLSDFTSLVFAKYLAKFAAIPVSIHLHPNYLKANKSKIEEIITILKEGIEVQKILNNTERKFAIDWIVEPLLNIRVMEKSINLKRLKGKFEGETAILVSAGPSLHENISFVQRMGESSHIFAVGPALRPLLINGIKPDYALSLDSSETNYKTHFKDIMYDGTLIFETMSNHQIQEQHKGKLIDSKALTEQITPFVFKDLFGFPHSAPSVAIFALQVIHYMGFKEVYLVGQDLALINGNYYAEGVKHHEGLSNIEVELFVDNNRGEKVGTTKALKLFLDSFEVIIRSFPKNSIDIFNISEFGAKIQGAEFLRSEKIIKKTLKKSVQYDDTPNRGIQHVDDFLLDFIHKLTSIKKEIERADKKIERHLLNKTFSSKAQQQMLKTFNEIANNEIVERVILSNLTFMFDNIINKIVYYDLKNEYTLQDLLTLTKELSALYKVMKKYIEEILEDRRLQSLKKLSTYQK
jgi:hypothetical protein